MKIVADDRIPFLKGVFEPFARVVYLPGKQICKGELLDADVLITRSVTKCDAALLDGTSVKLIATATIGDDHIDKIFCKKNGITVATATGCNASAVEQYITSALLILAEKKQFSIKGLKLGVVGVGNVGSRVKNVAELLGMKTLLNDPPRVEIEGKSGFVDLDELLEESDLITLHVPLTFDGNYPTYHLADDIFFSKIKKPVVFINSSRGKVVETTALKNAIKNGKIRASVIDVWENEPDIDLELLDVIDIATSHIAGYSLEGKARATQMTVETVSKCFGFRIGNWLPHMDEEQEFIEIDCTGLDEQNILFNTVIRSYDILKDDEMLRKIPENFELLRSDYNFRREYSFYKAKLENCKKGIKGKLKEIGFKVVN